MWNIELTANFREPPRGEVRRTPLLGIRVDRSVGAKGNFPWSIAGGAGSVCAPVVELYEPVNTLKPVGENLRVADGPIARMAYLGTSIPFPTRMVVVRLANGGLFLWSPTEPDEGLRSEIDALGPVCHLFSPNKIHYAHVAAWKRAYPGATAWASPGARERAASQGTDATFDADLVDEPEGAWSEDLDQLVFRGAGS